jgi:hypothetical protein
VGLSSTTNRVEYTGNGAVDTYAYTFRIFAKTDLVVMVRNTSDVETTLVVDTDYTVSGIGDASGGSIALVNSSQAWLDSDGDLKTDYILTIRRVRPLTQTANIRNLGDYYPETHENALDHLIMITQQHEEQLSRCLKQTATETGASLTLPLEDDRASKFLAFDADGEPIAAAGTTDVTVSAFAETLLDDADAAAMRSTLGMAGMHTAHHALMNAGLSATVGSNALTIALKTQAGSNATSSDPINIGFRSSTLTSGNSELRSVTGALSTVISSGSTAGHSSGGTHYLYVYALDNAGTVELAWSSVLHDEGVLQTTTAEGGAGAADSNRVLYSTTARASVPIRLLGRMKSTQTTAGTWAAAPTEVSMVPFIASPIIAKYKTSASSAVSSMSTATTYIMDYDTKIIDTHLCVTTGASWKFTAPRTSYYLVKAMVRAASSTALVATEVVESWVKQNGTTDLTSLFYGDGWDGGNTKATAIGSTIVSLAAGDYIDVRFQQTSGSTLTLDSGNGFYNYVEIMEIR